MLQIETDEKNIYSIATSKLTSEDYEKLLPILSKMLGEYDTVNWYFEMKDFQGWTLSAFWKDLEFDLKNMDRFGKIAMVGESAWQKVMTQLIKPFTGAEVRWFNAENDKEAREWFEN